LEALLASSLNPRMYFFPTVKRKLNILFTSKFHIYSHLQNLFAIEVEFDDSAVAITISYEKVTVL
jgi:hypothetical protein